MAIINLKAQFGMWTNHGKREIALAMVHRGEQFLGAGVLLKGQGGNGYVWRHLVCQGAELIMKGSLLLLDYDAFKPRLRELGHQLLVLADTCTKTFRLSPVSGDLRGELAAVSDLYEHHELRYASGMDILINPESIRVDLILRRLLAAAIVIRRAVAKDSG
jgi:hypothetical protein